MAITLLLVDADPAALRERAEALGDYDVLEASSKDAALAFLDGRRVDAILSQYRLPGSTGLELLRECATRAPGARRILLADHADLPELVAARAQRLVARVLPRSATPEKLREVVAETLGPEDERSVTQPHGLGWAELEELLLETAARLAIVRGVVVRPLPPDPRGLQMQFVVHTGARLEELRADILKRWLWPVKQREAGVSRRDRSHPVINRFGGLSLGSEVYAKHVAGEDVHAYVALLPWQREPRVTVALGVCAARFRPELWDLVVDLHRRALAEVRDFPLPLLPTDDESSGVGQPVPEYDWIVTDTYVGPDRRHAPTSFFNLYAFRGRRRRVPSRLARTTDAFTDRPSARVWRYGAACFGLAALDTWLTYHCVRDGTVREANPLLRVLVLHHPAAFFAVKTTLAGAAFLTVARFHLFRVGTGVLRATAFGYLALDAYWLALLAWRFL